MKGDIFECYGDVCFMYGMDGKCGPECPDYGLRDGCEVLDEEDEEEE